MNNVNRQVIDIVDGDAYNKVGAKTNSECHLDQRLTTLMDGNASMNLVKPLENSNALNIDPVSQFEATIANASTINNDQSPIITPLNATALIDNYNHTGITNVEDGYNASVENQLANSQDIPLYTQQPKETVKIDTSLENIVSNNYQQAQMTANATQFDNNPNTEFNNINMVNQDYNFYNTVPQSNYNNVSSLGLGNNNINQNYNMYETFNQTNYGTNNNPSTEFNNNIVNQNFNNNLQNNYNMPNGYIPKSEFASKPGVTETNFDRKMKEQTKKFNFVLLFLYILIIGVLAYIGYQFYIKANSFYVAKPNVNIASGSTFEEKIYHKGILEKNSNYEFTSANPNIATVDTLGNITGINPGTTTIKVKNKKTKKSEEVNVKVINLIITDFKTDVDEHVVYMGNTYTITPIINNQSSVIVNLEWSSSNENIARVTDDGIVQPISPGQAQITVKVPDQDFSATVNIIVVKN